MAVFLHDGLAAENRLWIVDISDGVLHRSSTGSRLVD